MFFISNLFPSPKNPEYGTFVKHNLDLLQTEYQVDCALLTKSNSNINKLLNYLVFFYKVIIKLILNNYDVIYIHYPSYSFIPIYIFSVFNSSVIKKNKMIVNLHGSDLISNRKLNSLLNRSVTEKALRTANCVVVPSDYFKQVVKAKGIDEGKIFVSYSGGYDPLIFNTTNRRPNKKLTLVFCSRLVESKGLSILVDSLISLVNTKRINPEKIQLIIIGDGPEREVQARKIEKNRIMNSVSFLGFKSQQKISEIYNESHVFIFPTQYESESLGLVGIEAMASGLILIGSDHPALKTYLKNGENGFTFSRGASEELSEIILELYKDFYKNEDAYITSISKKSLANIKSFDKKTVGENLLVKIRGLEL